jgi:hypothetical protein
MWVRDRHLAAVACVAALLTLTAAAHGWVETRIRSNYVTIDLERDGSATVAHEILMKVRGGPLKGYELGGVDSDAAVLPDGTVARARSGSTAADPIPLLIDKREDGSVRLEIDQKQGLRSGSYLFKFRYRTDFAARNLIVPDGARVAIRWVGPRFADGIDSARVVYRLPAAKLAPRLPPVDAEQVALGLADDPGGIFLSSLRRAHDKDEFEILRPHIAKGEPVVWPVHADARAFSRFAPEPVEAEPALVEQEVATPPQRRALLLAGALALALLYSALVAFKWHAFSRSCAVRRARPRALVALPIALRAALAGMALSVAATVATLTSYPTLAGVALVVAMALAAQRGPRAAAPLRGPGRWRVFSDEAAFARRGPGLPGRWLDTGAVAGFLLFVALLAGFAYGALRLLPSSAYHALVLALGSASLLPIFCTGRASELPADPVTRPRPLLSYLARRLRRDGTLQAAAWGRLPVGAEDPDELRLLVMPRRPLSGVAGIEVGLEYQYGGGGPVALPYALVRVQDGSPGYQALCQHVSCVRGRSPEERVAVIRPKLPTRRMTLKLVERIASLLTQTGARGRAAQQGSPRFSRAA